MSGVGCGNENSSLGSLLGITIAILVISVIVAGDTLWDKLPKVVAKHTASYSLSRWQRQSALERARTQPTFVHTGALPTVLPTCGLPVSLCVRWGSLSLLPSCVWVPPKLHCGLLGPPASSSFLSPVLQPQAGAVLCQLSFLMVSNVDLPPWLHLGQPGGPTGICDSPGLWSPAPWVPPTSISALSPDFPASCSAVCHSLAWTLTLHFIPAFAFGSVSWQSPVTDDPAPPPPCAPTAVTGLLRKSHGSVVTLNPRETHQHPPAIFLHPLLSCFYIVNYVLHSEECVKCLFIGWRIIKMRTPTKTTTWRKK